MSLKKLYKELNTLKWDSESMDWNLAIEAVLNEIEEMMKETIEDDFIIKDCIECSGKVHYIFIVKIFMKEVVNILIIKDIKIME
jgi:hypothetical protein